MTRPHHRTHARHARTPRTLCLTLLTLLVSCVLASGLSAQPAEETPPADATPPASDTPSGEAPAADTPSGEAPASDAPPPEAGTTPATESVIDGLTRHMITLRLPAGTRLSRVLADERANIFLIGLGDPMPGIELYIIDLVARGIDPNDDKAVNREMNTLANNMMAIEKALDLDPKGRVGLRMTGCDATSNTYQDGKHEVRVVACAHPSGKRLYLWRLDLASALAEQHAELVRRFEAHLVESVDLLSENGEVLRRSPGGAPATPPGATSSPPPGSP